MSNTLPAINDLEKLSRFEQAFSGGVHGCRRACHCGREYFDSVNSSYQWDDGELEALQSGDGIPLEHTVGLIQFEGYEYVDGCFCWHNRAAKIMSFIDGHASQIAKYLTLEKQAKEQLAKDSPTVG